MTCGTVSDLGYRRADLYYSCQSYCEQCWVSDYEWNKLLDWLE